MEKLYGWTWQGLLEAKWIQRLLDGNGLRQSGEKLLAPDDRCIGMVLRHRDPLFRLVALLEVATVQGDSRVVAWWPKPRSAWTIWMGDEMESGRMLGPEEVVCDLCNDAVLIRPVPVVDTYALCAGCFARSGLVFPGCIKPYIPIALLPTGPGSVTRVQEWLKQIVAAWRQALPDGFLDLAIYADEETWLQGGQPEFVGRYPVRDPVRTQ